MRRQRPAPRREPAHVPAVAVRRGHDAARHPGVLRRQDQGPGGREVQPADLVDARRGRGPGQAGGRRGHLRRPDPPARVADTDRPRASRGLGLANSFPQSNCGEAESRDCFSIEHYMEELFLKSDTTMAILSAVPCPASTNSPLSPAVMAETRRIVRRRCAATTACCCTGRSRPARGAAAGVARRDGQGDGHASGVRRGRCTRTRAATRLVARRSRGRRPAGGRGLHPQGGGD